MNKPVFQLTSGKNIMPQKSFKDMSVQDGAALLITMVVVLALSIVAVGVTGGNQAQSLMARNSQFRMESFNASYTEIDAQIDAINKRKISDGLPGWMATTLNNGLGSRMSSGAEETSERIELKSTVEDRFSNREVAQEFRGHCTIFGQQIGAGKESYKCNELVVESNAVLKNTSIKSEQSQVYEYYTKN